MTKQGRWNRGWLLAALLCALPGAVWAAGPDLKAADALIKGGKAGEAYESLLPYEFEMSGKVEYDYLLGVSALDSGKPDKATLAFERVLAVNPNFAGARLDMARAYFAMGDYTRAEMEFKTILEQNPPPTASMVVGKYLRAIEERRKAEQGGFTGFVEGALGYDDNVSSVTTDFTSGVQSAYNIANVLPTGNSLMRHSGFYSLGGGFDLNQKVGEGISIYGGLEGRNRNYYAASAFDTTTVDGRLGVSVARDRDLFRIGFQLQSYLQEGSSPTNQFNDRDSTAFVAEWRRMVNETNQVGLFGMVGQQEYKYIPTNDVDQTLVGATWLHAFGGKGNPLLFASLTYGEDRAKQKLTTGTDVSKHYTGLRFYGQYSLGEQLDLFANVGYQWRDDKTPFARSVVTPYGKDELADLTVGLNWRPRENLTVRPQIMYSRNDSNITLYRYDRTEASVTARYDFR